MSLDYLTSDEAENLLKNAGQSPERVSPDDLARLQWAQEQFLAHWNVELGYLAQKYRLKLDVDKLDVQTGVITRVDPPAMDA